jgi:hypothetical protein
MNLNRNEEVKIKAWFNDQLICDDNWIVFSQEEDDTFYIFVKDPNSESQIKFKMEKSINIESSL